MSDSLIDTEAPKRRFLDRSNSSPTLVGAGSRFEGDLRCSGDLTVAGEVIGNGHVQGMLMLSEGGSWHGELHCAHALLAGALHGDVVVEQKLEIRASARIHGRVTAQHLAIAEGAVVEGEIAVLSGTPIKRFEEKRNR